MYKSPLDILAAQKKREADEAIQNAKLEAEERGETGHMDQPRTAYVMAARTRVPTPADADLFLEQLEETYNLPASLKSAGMNMHSFRTLYRMDEPFRQRYEEIVGFIVPRLELKLLEIALGGDTFAASQGSLILKMLSALRPDKWSPKAELKVSYDWVKQLTPEQRAILRNPDVPDEEKMALCGSMLFSRN